MKKLPSVKAFMAVIAILFVTIFSANIIDGNKKNKPIETTSTSLLASNGYIHGELFEDKANRELLAIQESEKEKQALLEEQEKIVYDGLTLEELAKKLDRNLKSTLKGYGAIFAKYAIQYNVDPYLSLAIVLHETGCYSGKCSGLTSQCNNVGGMKGSNECGTTGYAKFKSLEKGIEAFYKNLSQNYYQKGLTTPEKIGKKYAESQTWASRIKYYIQIIKKS